LPARGTIRDDRAVNYALIPAAGSGSRLGSTLAKQYRDISGRPMICFALETFAACARIERIFVVIEAADLQFDAIPLSDRARIKVEALRVGGKTRHESVENGLTALHQRVNDSDWMLVHDAARPGLPSAMLERLIAEVGDDEVGGLLGLPVADTLKHSGAGHPVRSISTASRATLWQAQTPQMFRYRMLLDALVNARAAGQQVTDEASAIELAGRAPLLIHGHRFNFKVTYPDDLELAALLLGSVNDNIR
jgi:2-C-methyl-D-erythritol 4-phosphate cytidylyltransferase